MFDTEMILDSILNQISSLVGVQSIGISGGKAPLPKKGEGDIDVFIYCETIPSIEARQSLLNMAKQNNLNKKSEKVKNTKVNVFEGGHWGTGDFLLINGVETWLMYFTLNETITDVEKILSGKYPDRQGYYYPVGRLAMLKNIHIICDKMDFLAELKKRLSIYPEDLAYVLKAYHIEALEDREDLERAVVRRDVLFYHFSLDIAIDHFLQALFALNITLFPSRKRSLEYLNTFQVKPELCEERLLEIIRLGSTPEGIPESYGIWSSLLREIKELCVQKKDETIKE